VAPAHLCVARVVARADVVLRLSVTALAAGDQSARPRAGAVLAWLDAGGVSGAAWGGAAAPAGINRASRY